LHNLSRQLHKHLIQIREGLFDLRVHRIIRPKHIGPILM
jgi:hypothetical protein